MAEVGESITSPVKEKDRTETLGNFPKDARLEHVVLQGIPRETRDELSHALSIFPVDKRAIPDNVPPFQAVVLTPDKKQRESEDTEPADISYIFTPGITARAKHMTHKLLVKYIRQLRN